MITGRVGPGREGKAGEEMGVILEMSKGNSRRKCRTRLEQVGERRKCGKEDESILFHTFADRHVGENRDGRVFNNSNIRHRQLGCTEDVVVSTDRLTDDRVETPEPNRSMATQCGSFRLGGGEKQPNERLPQSNG